MFYFWNFSKNDIERNVAEVDLNIEFQRRRSPYGQTTLEIYRRYNHLASFVHRVVIKLRFICPYIFLLLGPELLYIWYRVYIPLLESDEIYYQVMMKVPRLIG